MRKKRAIRNFAGIIFLCLVLIVFSVISFNVPDTDKTFVGFIRGINLGIEYQGGTTITYKAYSNSSNNGNSGNGLWRKSVDKKHSQPDTPTGEYDTATDYVVQAGWRGSKRRKNKIFPVRCPDWFGAAFCVSGADATEDHRDRYRGKCHAVWWGKNDPSAFRYFAG